MHAQPKGHHGYLLYMHTHPGVTVASCMQSQHKRHDGYHAALVAKTEVWLDVYSRSQVKEMHNFP